MKIHVHIEYILLHLHIPINTGLKYCRHICLFLVFLNASICVFPLLYFIDFCLLNYNLALLNTYVKQEVNGYFVKLNY